jgi:YaiO family outer membrane protein
MILKKTYITFVFFMLASLMSVKSQNKPYNGDPDNSFEVARKLAFSDQRKQAQDTLLQILTKYPNYSDIRTFLATTYSWDGNYKKARAEFAQVIKNDPKNKENWIAAIKNESWSDNYADAILMADKALKWFPDDADIIILKATATEKTNNPQESLTIIETILEKNPSDQKALDYKAGLSESLRSNTIGIRAAVDVYSKVFDPMQYYTLSYGRQTKYGSIIGKVNFNRRFNENGTQIEVDLYPKITKGLYAYVNIGFANTFLFPDLRYGAELYKSLPHSLELSAGFRTLKYSTTTNIYTGSIGWYTGNSYWSLRPYFTPGDGGTSSSAAINYRKYRSDAANFMSFTFSMGVSPEVNQFIFSATDAAIINLKTQRLNASYFYYIKK